MRHNQGQNQSARVGVGGVTVTTDKPILTGIRHLIQMVQMGVCGECLTII